MRKSILIKTLWVTGCLGAGLSVSAEGVGRRASTQAPADFGIPLILGNWEDFPKILLTAGNTTVAAFILNGDAYGSTLAGADCLTCAREGMQLTNLRGDCGTSGPVNNTFVDGSRSCPLNTTIELGNVSATLPVQLLTYLPNDTTTLDLTERYNISGTFSLANLWNHSMLQIPSLPQKLYDNGVISEATASLYIAPDNQTAGELFLGDPRKSSHCDPSVSVTLPRRANGCDEIVTSQDYSVRQSTYSLNVDSMMIDGKVLATNFATLINYGSAPYQFPANIAFPLVQALFGGQATFNFKDRFTVPCNATLSGNVSFAIGGVEWPVTTEDFIDRTTATSNGTCGARIRLTDSCLSTLGIAFAKTVFASFESDTQAIRLSKYKN